VLFIHSCTFCFERPYHNKIHKNESSKAQGGERIEAQVIEYVTIYSTVSWIIYKSLKTKTSWHAYQDGHTQTQKFFEPTLPGYYSKLLSDISEDKDVNSSIIFFSPES
jgi:hypothetical protein